jgi:hypothetical protein
MRNVLTLYLYGAIADTCGKNFAHFGDFVIGYTELRTYIGMIGIGRISNRFYE